MADFITRTDFKSAFKKASGLDGHWAFFSDITKAATDSFKSETVAMSELESAVYKAARTTPNKAAFEDMLGMPHQGDDLIGLYLLRHDFAVAFLRGMPGYREYLTAQEKKSNEEMRAKATKAEPAKKEPRAIYVMTETERKAQEEAQRKWFGENDTRGGSSNAVNFQPSDH